MGQLFEEILKNQGEAPKKPKSLFEEIVGSQGPGSTPENAIDEEAPDPEIRDELRYKLPIFTANSAHATRELTRRGYEAKDFGDYDIRVKSKQDGKWYYFDPTKLELKDLSDVAGGVSNLAAQIGTGALTAIGSGPAAVVTAAAGAAGGAAAEEAARLQLGSRMFNIEPPTGEETAKAAGREAAYGAAGEILAPIVKPAFKLAGKALQLPYKAEQKAVDLATRVGGKLMGEGGGEAGEAPLRYFGKIKLSEKVTKEGIDSTAKSMEEETTRILEQLSKTDTLTERVSKMASEGGSGSVDDLMKAMVDHRVDMMTREKAMNDMAFEGKRLWYKWARQNARRTKGASWNLADENADKIFDRLHAKRSQLAKDSLEESIRLLKEKQPGLSDIGAKKLAAEAETIAQSELKASGSYEQASRFANESASSLAREVTERTAEIPANILNKTEDQIGGYLGGRGIGGFGRFATERGLYRAIMPMLGYQFTTSPWGLWGGVRALNILGKVVENTPQLLRRLVSRAPAPIAGRLKPVIDAMNRGDRAGAMATLSILLKNDAVRDWVEENFASPVNAQSGSP